MGLKIRGRIQIVNFTAVLFVGLLVFSSAFTASVPGLELPKVRWSYPSRSLNFLPEVIAVKRGYFKEEGVEVELIQIRANLTIAAFAAGDVHFSTSSGTILRGAAKGLPFRLLMSTQSRPPQILVARPEFATVASLKGKIIGTQSFAGSEYFYAREILKHHGLHPSRDVTIVIVGDSLAKLQAMESNSIQAGLLSAPFNVRAKKIGYHLLARAADYVETPNAGLGVTLQMIREKPEVVKRVVRATLRALRYIHDSRAGTISAIQDWLKMDRETAETAYDLTLPSFSSDGSLNERALEATVRLSQEQDAQIPKSISIHQLIEPRFIREAQREITKR
jgi:NitT/TauT family transport system substrate-binding protein